MTKKALVTGGSGFVASHLVPALLGAGWEVRSCGRRDRPALPEGVDYVRVDLADASADLASLVDGVTHVFHLAGASSSRSTGEQMIRDNVEATENLLRAVADTGPEVFLHMSSTSVYGEKEQLPVPVPETVEPSPSRGYGKAKWLTEQVVWRYADKGLPAVVLRPVSVHGPGATKLLASAVLDAAVERFAGLETLVVGGPAVEQRLVHIADVVGACLHLADHAGARGRAFNLAMPTYPTSHEVGAMLAAEFAMGFEVDDDPDCGPSHEERAEARGRMVEAGMTDDVLFTPERFRFMRKANINNRVDQQAILGTGFRHAETDLPAAIAELTAWCRERRWIL